MEEDENYCFDTPKKFFDLGENTYQVSDQGYVLPLFLPERGDDLDNRLGRKTRTSSICIRGKLEYFDLSKPIPFNAKLWVPASLNRIIVFVDWQPNAHLATAADLLTDANPESQYNLNNRKRFSIIFDKQFAMDAYLMFQQQNILSFQPSTHAIKWKKKIDIQTIFTQNNDGDIDNISSGAILMLMIGSNAYSVVQPRVIFNVSTRIAFFDA